MKINTNRLILTEVTLDDLNDIYELHSLPEIDEFNTLGIPENIEVTKKFLNTLIADQTKVPRSVYAWKIIKVEDNTFVGLAGMNVANNRFKLGEIYYNIHPTHWGNGFATEVGKQLISFGFDFLELHKIEAGVQTENVKSIRVLEKLGMTREGLRRKILPIRGEWKDNYHYAIVEDDVRPK